MVHFKLEADLLAARGVARYAGRPRAGKVPGIFEDAVEDRDENLPRK